MWLGSDDCPARRRPGATLQRGSHVPPDVPRGAHATPHLAAPRGGGAPAPATARARPRVRLARRFHAFPPPLSSAPGFPPAQAKNGEKRDLRKAKRLHMVLFAENKQLLKQARRPPARARAS